MEQYEALYDLWSTNEGFDPQTRTELLAIKGDPKEIEDRFYKDLAFGTGGLRGIIGAGTNRMNIYTVAKATAGLAKYIKKTGQEACARGVAISFDSRHFSQEFAHITARVLTAAGIKAFLSDELRPVPLLSYAVRHYGAFAGVMITASHNPAKYNGYKVYGEDGGQVTLEAADEILANIESEKNILSIDLDTIEEAKNKGLLINMSEDLEQSYTQMLTELVIDQAAIDRHKDMSIVYTPLHGSGNKPVRRILAKVGFTNVHVVPEQEQPDGDFPTVTTPNPEDPKALAMAVALAQKIGAGLVMGTDPDSDRVGVIVRAVTNGKEEFVSLTGNQIGILLLDYILSSKKDLGTLPVDSFAVTTIVSSKLAEPICSYYGVELQEVLTGFKFIGERIRLDDEEGHKNFQFGFEESYGYLSGLHVRDKDAVVSCMLIAGMAAQSMDKGETLLDRIQHLYQKFGYGFEEAVSFTLEGKEGLEKIKHAMESLRHQLQAVTSVQESASLMPGTSLMAVRDYQTGTYYDYSGENIHTHRITLPQSDVLLYELGGEKGLDWACVRPSGTEPKLKIYFGVYGKTQESTKAQLSKIKQQVSQQVEALL